ncbi:hypothetical protein ARMGADRAFT_1026365 [Armillaria gallica]|uniref:Uncharacterized protein n=1 Tax=Armillaria gallica TaxID=47427 RepID=A0A2H3EFY2_ARMGA|nr:hypothetical protein ARMGADRAFT_1026365 [Armillaria gallica]
MSIFEQEVERGSLLAERRETRMAVESESRTWFSLESILSLTTLACLKAVTFFKRPLMPPPHLPKPPPRKRRRSLLYKGPGDDGSIRSEWLKRWTVSVGKRERDRIVALEITWKQDGCLAGNDNSLAQRPAYRRPE